MGAAEELAAAHDREVESVGRVAALGPGELLLVARAREELRAVDRVVVLRDSHLGRGRGQLILAAVGRAASVALVLV